jgi:adenylate cyclase class 2
MPLEIEIKARVDSHEPVRRQLQAAGAEYIGRVIEVNRFFDNADCSLRRQGRGLRLRSCDTGTANKAAEGGCPPSATLTYKGPLRESPLKTREEVELDVSDVDAMARLLQSLGYQERVLFEKRRESWRFGGCHVELDELPRIGCFVEIEGPDEAAILRVMSRLNLSTDQSIRKAYVELLAEAQPSPGDGPLVVRFTE